MSAAVSLPPLAHDTLPAPPPVFSLVPPPALSQEDALEAGRHLVDRLARRFAAYGAGLDVDDLRQEGFIALFKAAKWWREKMFVEDRGEFFLAWASRVIRSTLGAVLTRERRRGLTGRCGNRSARALGFTVGKTTSMDAALDEDGRSMHDVIGARAEQEDAACEAEIAAKVRAAVDALDERDRAVWTLTADGMTNEEVGERLGIAPCQVSWRWRRLSEDIAALVENGKGRRPGSDRRDSRSNEITHEGETMSVAAWGRRLGLPARVIHKRLAIGWSIEDALTRPITEAKRTHRRSA